MGKEAIEIYSERFQMQDRYLPALPANKKAENEVFDGITNIVAKHFKSFEFKQLKTLDIGCGNGRKSLRLISYGISPANLTCVEMHEQLCAEARENLPAAVRVCNESAEEFAEGCPAFTYDVIVQSMLLSSITNHEELRRTCEGLAACLKPGGILISYDFCYTRPGDMRVRRITRKVLESLFPGREVVCYKWVTLIPQLARFLQAWAPGLIDVLRHVKVFNSHRLAVVRDIRSKTNNEME